MGWMNQLFTSSTDDALFQYLYPPTRLSKPGLENIFIEVLECILMLFQKTEDTDKLISLLVNIRSLKFTEILDTGASSKDNLKSSKRLTMKSESAVIKRHTSSAPPAMKSVKTRISN